MNEITKSVTMNFTGQRPKNLYGYDKDSYMFVVNAIRYFLYRYTVTNKCMLDCITGGAQGIDQCAFWAGYHLSCNNPELIQNIVYVPHMGQDSPWNDIGLFSKQEYRLMLEYADYYVFLNEDQGKHSYWEISKLLDERNKEMVKDSQVTVAVVGHQFQVPNKKSGTWNCISDAIKKGNVLYILRLPEDPLPPTATIEEIFNSITMSYYDYQNRNFKEVLIE